MQMGLFTIISLLGGLAGRRLGWYGQFQKLWPSIMGWLFIAIPVVLLSRKTPAVQKPSKWLGIALKVEATVLSVAAMALTTLALEPSSQSTWAPMAADSWAAWLLIAWLWILAAISFLVGDSQLRRARLEFEKKA
jgi:hypothetical protein